MYPRNYPHGPQIDHGIVISRGGETDDFPDSTHAGNMQIFFPTKFGPDVQREHIALSTKSVGATGGDQCTFAGQPDYGTVVTAFKETGRTDCIVAGMPNQRNIGSEGSPGNTNLMAALQDLASKSDGRQRPPDYRETKKNGALIREIVNKGDWFANLTQGLPVHAAMSNIAGNKLPSITNIPTAKQHEANIIGADIISQLQGTVMSLGQILQQAIQQGAAAGLSPNLQAALNSMQQLSQNGEINGSLTSGRVDSSTLANNATTLLSQSETIDDLVNVSNRLLYDTTLHGLEVLGNTSITVTNSYGNTHITIDSSGNVNSQQSQAMQQVIQQLQQLMSSAAAYPNAKQENLFGESAKIKMDMSMRIPDNIFKELSEKLNTSGDAQTNWKEGPKKVFEEIDKFFQKG